MLRNKIISVLQLIPNVRTFTKESHNIMGLDREGRRRLKKRLHHISDNMGKGNHIYKVIHNWETKEDLAMSLIDSEIYKSDQVIVLNKPYGLRSKKPLSVGGSLDKKILSKYVLQNQILHEYNIEGLLPILREHYNAPDLEIAAAPDRWVSGVTIFVTNPKYLGIFLKMNRTRAAQKDPHQTYVVLASGKPTDDIEPTRYGLSIASNEFGSMPILKKDLSKNDIKRRKHKINWLQKKTLDYSEDYDVSLCQVKCLHNRKNFVRLYMADSATPILGDSLFGYRVQTVLGKRVKVNPLAVQYSPPVVSDAILKALKLSKGSTEGIPCHSHLYSYELHLKGELPVSLTAPLPEYFTWTLDQLKFQNVSGDDRMASADFEESLMEEFEVEKS